MRIVITGGLGFIGQHLSARLVADGHEVLLIDSLSPQIHGELPSGLAPEGVTVARMDVCDLADRHDLLEGVDTVFHLAAETGTAQSMYEMSRYTRANCEGTSALLEAAAKCTKRPKQIVLASSRSVYGEGAYTRYGSSINVIPVAARTREALEAAQWEPVDETGSPVTAIATPENFPFSPGSIYAATKAAQELLLTSSSIALGMRVTVFRLQNVYGEGQSLRNPYTGIISIFFNRARQGLHIPLYEDGLESRDFIHIVDVVDALTASLNTILPNGIVINVGSGAPTSVAKLAHELLKASFLSVPVQVTGQFRLGDIRHCFADINKLKQFLGFTPKISLEMGLKRFCSWAITQPTYEDQSTKAENELRMRGLSK